MDGAIKNVTLLGHAPYNTAKYEKRANVSIFTHVIPRQANACIVSANFFQFNLFSTVRQRTMEAHKLFDDVITVS